MTTAPDIPLARDARGPSTRPGTDRLRRRLLLSATIPVVLALGVVFVALSGAIHRFGDGPIAASQLSALVWALGGISLGCLIVCLAFTRWTTEQILAPVEELHVVSARLAEGDCETPVEVRPNDDFASLSADLETMRISLHRQIAALAELDQMKSDFLGLASHELRTPVSIIQGCVDLLSLDTPAELKPGREQHGILEALQRAVESLSSLVNQVTDMTFLDRRRMTQDMTRHDLSALSRQASDRLKAEITKRTIEFSLELAPEECWVFADGPRLAQALDHLLRNALRFTPDGGVIILRTCRGEREVSYEVQDTGVGIPPEVQARIFDPLYEGKSHLHHQSGTLEFGSSGLGLGLAICQKIVKAHRGRIEVESMPGEGSLFRIALPRHIDNAVDTPPSDGPRPDPFLSHPFQDWSDPLSRAA